MTETQAKSGAAGASTDAEEPSVETPTPPDHDGVEPELAAIADPPGSPTNVIKVAVESSRSDDGEPAGTNTFSWPVASSASSSSSGSSTGGAAKSGSSGYTPTPTPTATPTVTPTPATKSTFSPTPVSKVEDPKVEPTVRAPLSGALTVPVVGVPASSGSSSDAATESPSKPAGDRVTPGRVSSARVDTPAKATPGSAGTRTEGAGKAVTGIAKVAASVPGLGQIIGRAGVTSPTGLRGPTTTPAGGRTSPSSTMGAARVTEAVRSARATVAGAATRGPRRARLHLKRIDPWSVMKFAFAVSLVLFVVAIVATSVLYLALDAMNVFDSINKALGDVTGQAGGDTGGFKITAKGVIGTSVLLGAVNMVLFTALMTLGAFVYNVCADLVGGIELTLSEKD